MIREFTQDDWMAYAGARRWHRIPANFTSYAGFSGSEPLILDLDERWRFIVSAEGTEVHKVNLLGGETVVYAVDLCFPTQRFAYSWLASIAFIYSMYGKFDPAEYGMVETARI